MMAATATVPIDAADRIGGGTVAVDIPRILPQLGCRIAVRERRR
jgi:hypothetical protein